MPRRKKPEPVVVEARPEPEGQGDWLYSCTSCGYQLKAGPDFNQPCSKCDGHGWQCHWLKMSQPTTIKSANGAANQQNSNERHCGNNSDPIKRRADILLPLNHKPDARNRRNSRGLTSVLGRREMILPTDLINKLADQGLGCKAIAIKLQNQGIVTSHMTIQRRLKESRAK